MPIYEFACPKCRKIFSFLSKRVNPDRLLAMVGGLLTLTSGYALFRVLTM